MKKGEFVLVEKQQNRCVLGTVVSYDEASWMINLKEVGETEASAADLVSRQEKQHFTIYPKKVVVEVNLSTCTLWFVWVGRPPKGWKSSVAAEEERCHHCEEEEEEEAEEDEE